MTFEQMKIFVEAARYGSFTHAAEKLGLTQSAVSISIKKLEDRHNVRLFDRSGRRLMVTEAGQVLLNEAERILRDVELTVRRVESMGERDGRRPILACTRNAYDHWMPGLLARFGGQKELPDVELIAGSADDVTAWVMRGTADVGISETAPGHAQFRYLGVFRDALTLVATPARARTLPPRPSWTDLPECAPVIWEQGDLAAVVTEALSAHGVDPRRVAHSRLRLDSTAAVLSLVGSGRFPGFVTLAAARAALAAGELVRVGAIEVPVRYWMFAPREREIEPLAALVATAATDQQAAERTAAPAATSPPAAARRSAVVG
jgi:DNA-binding transcriptional LysR family regulator